MDAITGTLSRLAPDEAFFSIDELGPVAVKMRSGRSLQLPGQIRTVPQWQKSRGAFILSAALELATNQVTFFFSTHKNTAETIKLIEILRAGYRSYRKLYLSWDAAPWHKSELLNDSLAALNERALADRRPVIAILPLPTSAQFLNVIEAVFSGMSRAILHNSNYSTLDDAKAAIARYLDERNRTFLESPGRAGRSIWGKEPVSSVFTETNNCKDPGWR